MAKVYSNLRHGRSKYGVKTDAHGKLERTSDGILFASQSECRRYGELKLLAQAGAIHHLALQPTFDLDVMGGDGKDIRYRIGGYTADFQYTEWRTGQRIVEDVKGFRTPLYRWKKRHVEAQYGIVVREIR